MIEDYTFISYDKLFYPTTVEIGYKYPVHHIAREKKDIKLFMAEMKGLCSKILEINDFELFGWNI